MAKNKAPNDRTVKAWAILVGGEPLDASNDIWGNGWEARNAARYRRVEFPKEPARAVRITITIHDKPAKKKARKAGKAAKPR